MTMTPTKLFLAACLLCVLSVAAHAVAHHPSHGSSLPLPGGSWVLTAKPQSIEVEEIEGDDDKFLLKATLGATANGYMAWKCDTVEFSRGDEFVNDHGHFVRQDLYEKICALRQQDQEKKATKTPPSDGGLSFLETLLLAFVPLPSGLVLGQKWKKKLTNMTKAHADVTSLLQEDETKLKQLKDKLADFKKKKGLDLTEDADLEEMEALLEDV